MPMTKITEPTPLDETVSDFLEDFCVRGGGFVPKAALRTEYINWCRRRGIPPVNRLHFSQMLRTEGFEESNRQFPTTVPVWTGIGFKEERPEREFKIRELRKLAERLGCHITR